MSKELIFASEEEAVQHLADITGKEVKIASELPNIDVYDNGGESMDQYTIVLLDEPVGNGNFAALGLSTNPNSPQGFSQMGEASNGSHLGKKIKFEDLPEVVQKHATERLT